MPHSERHAVQLRIEALNVLNDPSWGARNGNILAGPPIPGAPANAAHEGFGVITSTAIPMRQIQIGLKYSLGMTQRGVTSRSLTPSAMAHADF
jgi:hypothetical protein